MSATITGAAAAAPKTYEDLSLEEVLDELDNVNAYINANMPKIQAAQKEAGNLRTMAQLLLEKEGARRFDNGRKRCFFKRVKAGSAKVDEPGKLRTFLQSLGTVPLKDIDAALPIVIADPVVKPDLRKVRKLAEFGRDVAKAITAHVLEPLEFEQFIIEDVMLDVTPASVPVE